MAEYSAGSIKFVDEELETQTTEYVPEAVDEEGIIINKQEDEDEAETIRYEYNYEPVNTDDELVCQPCKDDGKTLPAKGFCVTCGEHLCEHCFKHHIIPRPSRNHVLQDKDEMPKEIPTKNVSFKPCHMCAIHDNELIVSFCKDHEMLCCTKCVELTHQLCEDVESIETKCADIEDDEDLQSFLDAVIYLKEDYEQTRSIALRNKEEADWYYEHAVHAFKQAMGKIHQSDQEQLTRIVGDCDKILLQLSDAIQGMDKARESRGYRELFIKMTLLRKHEDIIKNNLDRLNSQNKFERYFLLPNVYSTNFGQVLRISVCKDKLEHLGTDCHQLILFPQQRLLVVSSETISLLNYSKKERMEYTSLGPCKSSVHSTDNEVLVVVPKSTYFHLNNGKQTNDVKAFDKEYVRRTVFTKTTYSPIIYNDDTFTAFQINTSGEVAVVELDRNGAVQRTINDNLAATTASWVQYIKHPADGVYDDENDVMYVTDSEMDSVFKMTRDGECHCIVVSERLASPAGIAVCRDGTLMVCCTQSKCIVKVTKDGQIYSFIGPLEFEPRALAYDKASAFLYVGGVDKAIHTFYA